MSDAPKHPGPDFSQVDSLAKAETLHREGVLETLLLLPRELGGEEVPGNVLFVPLGVGAMKARIDVGVIVPLAREGKVTKYSAEPEYEGDSFIPVAIRVHAHSPGEFRERIVLWGKELAEGHR